MYNCTHKLESTSAIVIAIYPGSFDPVTLGHLDLIQRGSKLFERIIVAVLRNPNKTPLFTVEQRLEQIRYSTKHLPNVEVDSFDGLTVNYAHIRQAQVLLRGLRAISDFEIELSMAHTNKTLSTQIETVFLATSNEYSFLSSSVVKEIARFGGAINHLVPPHVALDIYQCYAHNYPMNQNTTEVTSHPLGIAKLPEQIQPKPEL
jgi:pantetheine-phosphate adenylyltransferase